MANANDTHCILCGEHIDQHTGRYLVCPDGIHEFESVADARKFERDAYLNLADEFDPMGATHEPTLDEFDPGYIAAARRFASDRGLPLPWDIRSMDEAARLVKETDR